jgi:large conductance mechanosensitive channel
MGMLSEFRTFAVKGNVMDLAVGVIIGAAFGKIVDSLVNDIIMPVIGAVFGGFDFSNLFIKLGKVPPGIPETLADLKKAGVPVLAYGNFITIVLNFIILAFVVFMIVRTVNKMREEDAAKPAPAPPEDVMLLREIRDALRAGR